MKESVFTQYFYIDLYVATNYIQLLTNHLSFTKKTTTTQYKWVLFDQVTYG